MPATRRLRIFTAVDVAKHTRKGDCWVIRNGKVYNVSEFAADHPGGDDLIFKYAGQDVGEIMKNSDEHDHSQSAYEMLGEYLIGKIGVNTNTVDESEPHFSRFSFGIPNIFLTLSLCLFTDWEAPDDFHPEETLPEEDFSRCEFLDLSKPLLRQVWECNFSKEFYLQQVHQPRHVTKTARLFGPDYLEVGVIPSVPCWLHGGQ